MAHSIVMPALEMAQETGKLLAWRKKEGEAIAKGEPLLDVETDKAVVEIESPADGILAGIKAHAGAVIPVGQTIAWIVAPGETPPAEEASAASGRRMDSAPAAAAPPAASVAAAATAPAASARISPRRGGSPGNMAWILRSFAELAARVRFQRTMFWHM
jgi:pyruvate dehydrogenase E2 component (dihydrolipoamide acetyltransferase)